MPVFVPTAEELAALLAEARTATAIAIEHLRAETAANTKAIDELRTRVADLEVELAELEQSSSASSQSRSQSSSPSSQSTSQSSTPSSASSSQSQTSQSSSSQPEPEPNDGALTNPPSDWDHGAEKPIAAVEGGPLWKTASDGTNIGAWQATGNVEPGPRSYLVIPLSARPANPATIDQELATGGNIYLEPGRYGPLRLSRPDTHLWAERGAVVEFDRPTDPTAAERSRGVTLTADRCGLHGLTVRAGYYLIEVAASDCIVADCEATGWADGSSKEGIQILTGERNRNRVEHCRVSGTSDGISAQGRTGNVVHANLIHDTSDDAIEVDKADDATVTWNRTWAGRASSLSLQGVGPGPFRIRHNQFTGTLKYWIGPSGITNWCSPIKNRLGGTTDIEWDHNTVLGQHSSGYLNGFLSPTTRVRNSVWWIKGGAAVMENSSSEPLRPIELDYNAYRVERFIYNYAGMTTLAQLRQRGFEAHGLTF